jgi:glycyl-tRNA synthetase beta chain
MSDHADLLFELGTEELPPVALKKLSHALESEFVSGLQAAGLAHGQVTAYATPRRLALLIEDLQTGQADRQIQKRGPAVKAAFDAQGKPTKAAEGFARSCGVTVDELQRLQTDKGEWLAYQVREAGKPAAALLPGIAENALNSLPIPKRMRWGDSEAQFVRPVHWLLFLHGDQIVDCTLLDAQAGRTTLGHRFHHPEPIALDRPADYAEVLQGQGRVIAHFAERRERIKIMVEQTATGLGGVAGMDDDLLDEVTALNEWPMPIAGSFEERFLEVPHEALATTMKTNQKYFPVFDAQGNLLNHFITIANIDSKDPATIRAGNERVVRPRLADAMFFWQQDGKKRLQDHQASLKKVVFQKQLGSLHDKSVRVAELAAQIAQQIGGDVELARRAGRLSRCDLMTEMVGEFASMQGIMGRYQAKRDGEPDELAYAMDEFYMPRFSGDQLPQTKTGIAIALAERLDTLVGIFGIGMKPTGDKDPFALRRAALGALRILREHHLALNLHDLLQAAKNQLNDQLAGRITEPDVLNEVERFMLDRLRGLYADLGISADLFAAVAAVKPTDLGDFEQRIQAVAHFRQLPEAEALAAANKRIANLLKKVEGDLPSEVDAGLLELSAEQHLFEHIQTLQQTTLQAKGDYAAILQALAGLREPVDQFFDDVMVMADDPNIRNNRLALLNQLAGLFLQVADVALLQPA